MTASQKITPFLWFDGQAEEAMHLYTSIFDNAKVVSIRRYPDGPLEGPMAGMEGKVLTAVFELAGFQLMALDGGPQFKFTPAISFFVNCETEAELDKLWAELSKGGSIAMPLQAYPFSQKFGWVADKYGLSWQLNLAGSPQNITPFLLFVGPQGQAEAAVNDYIALFENSGISHLMRFEAGEPGVEGSVKQAAFTLSSQPFMAMDGGPGHPFSFTEAISFYVNCDTQEEVDHFWHALSAHPEAEQCGWLKDKFGISWQIIPSALPELMNDPDPEKSQRVMQAMLPMKKIEIASLQQAYQGA
jgi:predicted 3-demethylubiquinone-9 3-methyltransferase (glyoxalase superfamily)